MPFPDPDQPDPRMVAQLVQQYEASARRLREQIISPPGKSPGAQTWNQNRATQILAQVEREIAALKKQATAWTGTALSGAVKRGVNVADRQVEAVIPQPPDSPFKGKGVFSVVDHGALKVLAKDTVGDLHKAADALRGQAANVLHHMAATGVSNAEVNTILTGGIIEGKPVQAIRELREALKKVHGEKVTITDKNGQPMEFETGYYARMVAVTKTRAAVCTARHARLQERGIDLVVVIGRQSANFCTAYMDKVFSISGASDTYPPLSSLPSGGPPFHPNCSKGTAPFIEALADPEEIAAGLPDPDTDKLLNVRDRTELQRRYEALRLQPVVRARAATLRTDAGRKAITHAQDDPPYQEYLIRGLGVKSVRLGGDAAVGESYRARVAAGGSRRRRGAQRDRGES